MLQRISKLHFISEISDVEVAQMITWMKANSIPESKVRDYMDATRQSRISWLKKSKDLLLGKILMEYPKLIAASDNVGVIIVF